MKIRNAFVSNSSSSSFVIEKKWLSPAQIEKILHHDVIGEQMGLTYANSDQWKIREVDDLISGETWMDNFNMKHFLETIGVPMDKVEWADVPIIGFMDEILLPQMKEDEDFVKRLEIEVEMYKEEGGNASDFLKWIKEKMGM